MSPFERVRSSPRAFASACAAGATAAGVVYLTLAEAPPSYAALNIGALAIGVAAVRVLLLLELRYGPARGGTALALGLALLATAASGVQVEGAARWVRVGALFIQPSLVAVPLLVMIHARAGDRASTLAVLVGALALASQPDRAMAGALALGVGAVCLARPDRGAVVALAGASAAFAATLARPDALPAVPYVDGILYTSFDLGPIAGSAVLGGALLLLAPALAGLKGDAAHRPVHAAFGAVWLGVVAAAALGNYPTPVVGYGGSAILGYLLSLVLLPGRVAGAPVRAAGRAGASDPERDGLPMTAGVP